MGDLSGRPQATEARVVRVVGRKERTTGEEMETGTGETEVGDSIIGLTIIRMQKPQDSRRIRTCQGNHIPKLYRLQEVENRHHRRRRVCNLALEVEITRGYLWSGPKAR